MYEKLIKKAIGVRLAPRYKLNQFRDYSEPPIQDNKDIGEHDQALGPIDWKLRTKRADEVIVNNVLNQLKKKSLD